MDGLKQLAARVHDDEALALRLRRIDPDRFTEELLSVAGELGFELTEPEIAAAIARGRQAWMLRWVR